MVPAEPGGATLADMHLSSVLRMVLTWHVSSVHSVGRACSPNKSEGRVEVCHAGGVYAGDVVRGVCWVMIENTQHHMHASPYSTPYQVLLWYTTQSVP